MIGRANFESKIQSKIVAKFKQNGWTALKLIRLSKAGYPDLMLLKNGVTVFIEVMDTGKQPNELKLFRIHELNKNGFIAFWTDNEKDDRILNLI